MPAMIRMLLFACALPTHLLAQRPGEPPPVIDTIVIEVANVFRDEEAGAPVKRFMNSIHVPTKRHVILNQLLLRPGDPYDSVLAAESEQEVSVRGVGWSRLAYSARWLSRSACW